MKTEPDLEGLKQLQEHMKGFFPVLDNNLAAAHDEYMNGEIANGAYQYVLSRHANATIIAKTEEVLKLEPQKVFITASAIFLDFGACLEDIKEPKKKKEFQDKVDNLEKLFIENGFTEKNPIFKIPEMPRKEAPTT